MQKNKILKFVKKLVLKEKKQIIFETSLKDNFHNKTYIMRFPNFGLLI
jgi:hypothetical protein